MADANIFAQYLRPMKTVADYQAEGDAADLRRQQLIGAQRQNALASLVAQQQQQTMAETAADNERVRQAYADAGGDQNRLLSILRGPTATKGTVSHADAVEAAMLKRRETLAKAGEEEGKTTDAALKRYSGMLGTYVKDPQTAALWYQAQYTDPVIGKMMQQVHGPLDQVVGQIPQDPQGFARWVQQTRDGMTKYAEAVAPKPTEVKLGNRVAFIDTNPQSPTFRQELTSSTIGTSPDTVYTQGQENYRQGVRLKQEKELAGQGGSVIDTDQGKMWVPNKPQPGSVIRATPVIGPTGLQPLQGPQKPLPEGAQKQVVGARNLQDAIANYQEKLADWSNRKMLSPDSRLKMGNAYNNMMLQAKEAYNLGVLNGPDYDILQKVVMDPTNAQAAVVSNEALSGQASELDRIAKGIERTVLETHGQRYTPRSPSGKPASGTTLKFDANGNLLP